MPAEIRALDQLEQLVDQFKLSGVIEMLRDVCEVKKEHIIDMTAWLSIVGDVAKRKGL